MMPTTPLNNALTTVHGPAPRTMSERRYDDKPTVKPTMGPKTTPPTIVKMAGKLTNCSGPNMLYLIILSETARAISMAVKVIFFVLLRPIFPFFIVYHMDSVSIQLKNSLVLLVKFIRNMDF
jgi:hypothetical protein